MKHVIRSHNKDKTNSILIIGDQQFKAEELPWNNNIPGKSCIPDGVYSYRVDYSVNKSRGVIELLGVPNRSQIQFHAKGKRLYGCVELLPDGLGETAREVEDLVTKLMSPCGYVKFTTLK